MAKSNPNAKSFKAKAAHGKRRVDKQNLLAKLYEKLEVASSIERVDIENAIKDIKSQIHIHNAKSIEYDGHKFPSTLEKNFYQRLKESGLPFSYQFDMPLQGSFYCNGKLIKPIEIRVDFLICNKFIVDTKGLFTEKAKIKWKMLMYRYRDNYEYFTPRNTKECDSLCLYLISRFEKGNI